MEITSKKTTKLVVPHKYAEGCPITGVLEQLAPDEPTQGRSIALILHGSMGHKDYLFQKRLALRLPIDSFRFDFRGNFETPGHWRLGNLYDDVEDIHVVAEYLKRQYGYELALLVGHSRGSVTSMLYLCTRPLEETRSVRGFVNVSGRYRMYKTYEQIRAPENQQQMNHQGYYEVKAIVARKPFVVKVTTQDHHEFARIDTPMVWDRFPSWIDVLTMHGMRDTVVPPYDAIIYSQALGARSPGAHNLCMVEDADHNFTGIADSVVSTIVEWWGMRERHELKTGIWHTGVRPRL